MDGCFHRLDFRRDHQRSQLNECWYECTVVHIARSTKDFLVFEYADKLAQTLEMLESALDKRR